MWRTPSFDSGKSNICINQLIDESFPLQLRVSAVSLFLCTQTSQHSQTQHTPLTAHQPGVVCLAASCQRSSPSPLRLRTTPQGWLVERVSEASCEHDSICFQCWWRGRRRQRERTPLFFFSGCSPPHSGALEGYLSHAFLVKGSTDGLLVLTVIWCKCDLMIRWGIAVGSVQPLSCRRTTGTHSFTQAEEMRRIKKEQKCGGGGRGGQRLFSSWADKTHPSHLSASACLLLFSFTDITSLSSGKEREGIFSSPITGGDFVFFLFPLCESGGAAWFCLSGFLHFKEPSLWWNIFGC